MKKILITLVIGGILIGAVYATAATLTITTPDQIGAGTATIDAPVNVSALDWNVDPTDAAVAKSVELTLSDNGAASDVVNFQIQSDADTTCSTGNETAIYTIAGTGAAGTTSKFFYLDLAAGGAASPTSLTVGDGSIEISSIDCVNITIEQNN